MCVFIGCQVPFNRSHACRIPFWRVWYLRKFLRRIIYTLMISVISINITNKILSHSFWIELFECFQKVKREPKTHFFSFCYKGNELLCVWHCYSQQRLYKWEKEKWVDATEGERERESIKSFKNMHMCVVYTIDCCATKITTCI